MFQQHVLLLAQKIMHDDAFGQAISILCSALSQIVRGEPRLVKAMGDYGAFAIVICAVGIADEGDGRFTFAAIQAVVVRRGWASSRRTRALIDWMEWSGAALRQPARADNRERPWCICGWLPAALSRIAGAFLNAIAPLEWLGSGFISDLPVAVEKLIANVSRLIRSHPLLFDAGAEMQLFARHAAGYPILLEMIGACGLTGGTPGLFSRKSVARGYSVSRAHVTAIIAAAERLGMLYRTGGNIILSKTMALNIHRDLAHQLAIVVLSSKA